MSNTLTAKSPIISVRPYVATVGLGVYGLMTFGQVPKSSAGRWVEVKDVESTWVEKPPSGSTIEYVNKD